jgi:hypothetical protein
LVRQQARASAAVAAGRSPGLPSRCFFFLLWGGMGGEGSRAHLFKVVGEEKHSGAGERAGNAVSAAACASLTPWASKALEGVMGDRQLANIRKGELRNEACCCWFAVPGGEGRGAVDEVSSCCMHANTTQLDVMLVVTRRGEGGDGGGEVHGTEGERYPQFFFSGMLGTNAWQQEKKKAGFFSRTVLAASLAALLFAEGRSGVNMPMGSWSLSMAGIYGGARASAIDTPPPSRPGRLWMDRKQRRKNRLVSHTVS